MNEVEKCIEMLELSGYTVYGSPCRPMSRSWAPISDAEFIPSDPSTTGYHTYVAVPIKLSREEINRYELVLVSHSMSDEERKTRQEAWDKNMADFVARIIATGNDYSDKQILDMFWGKSPIGKQETLAWEEVQQ